MDPPPKPGPAYPVVGAVLSPPEPPLRALLNRHRSLVEWLRSISSSSSDSPSHKQWAEQSVCRLQGVPVNTVREPSIALLGRAGIGKSTLANTLLGYDLLPATQRNVAMVPYPRLIGLTNTLM